MSGGFVDALAVLELADPAMMLATVAMVIMQIAQSNTRPTLRLICALSSVGSALGEWGARAKSHEADIVPFNDGCAEPEPQFNLFSDQPPRLAPTTWGTGIFVIAETIRFCWLGWLDFIWTTYVDNG